MTALVWQLFLLSAFIAAYNGAFVGRIGRLAPLITRHLPMVDRFGWTAVNDVTRLTIAAVAQFLALLVLVLVTGVDPLAAVKWNPALLAAGALLGVAEMGLASLMAHALMRTMTSLAPARSPGVDDWLVVARGGWMRYFTHAIRITPLWYLLSVTLLYVAVEEIIFRDVIITYLRPRGSAVALLGSVAAFTVVQILHTPSWKTGMFPAVSALAVGCAHGWLFLVTGDIAPLIVAHFTFFLGAVL